MKRDIPEKVIQNKLSAIQRRMQLDQLFRHLTVGGFWGGLAGALPLIVSRWFPLPSLRLIGAFLILTALGIATGVTLWRRTDLLSVARLVDARLNLKERLSTALESIQQGSAHDFAALQIHDAARVAREIEPAAAVSYRWPPMARFLSIPILLAVCSFFIPRMYEVATPPTAAEKSAIADAADMLERRSHGPNAGKLDKQIEKTTKALRNGKISAREAQRRLSTLRDEIRTQKRRLLGNELNEIATAVSEAAKATTLLNSADAAEMASDLEKLAQQMNALSAEQKAELAALLRKLADQLSRGALARGGADGLKDLKTQAVTPEMLKSVARALMQADQRARDMPQLEEILDEIRASQRDIGLAGIQMRRQSGGVASAGGGPGEEAETGEAQGTQVSDGSDFAPQPTTKEAEDAIQTGETSVESSAAPHADLRLTSIDSDSQHDSSTRVQGEVGAEEEPIYMKYRKVALSAKHAYASAMERNQIPVRYQKRVKDYLDTIANARIDE